MEMLCMIQKNYIFRLPNLEILLKKKYRNLWRSEYLYLIYNTMNLQELQQQYITHWPTLFAKHYSVSILRVYQAFWKARDTQVKRRIPEPVPLDWLTKEERRYLFYILTGIPKEWRWASTRKQQSLEKSREIVRMYVHPTPEKYTWPFLFAFNKL